MKDTGTVFGKIHAPVSLIAQLCLCVGLFASCGPGVQSQAPAIQDLTLDPSPDATDEPDSDWPEDQPDDDGNLDPDDPTPIPTKTSTPPPTPPGKGVCGSLYDLKTLKPKKLPDFSTLIPVGRVILNEFQVAKRSYKKRIPGVPAGMTEWYGLQFRGFVTVPKTGTYQFSLRSDDGSRLRINNQVVINHDGQHSATAKTGEALLEAGTWPFTVDYFQGPKGSVALWMAWKTPGAAKWVPIPATVFSGSGYDDQRCY